MSPLAILALVLRPIVWLLTLPFRLVGIAARPRDTILILNDTVNIEYLTVTGGLNGIRLQGPSYAGVTHVLVQNTAGNGILVRAGDIAILSSTVEHADGSGSLLFVRLGICGER